MKKSNLISGLVIGLFSASLLPALIGCNGGTSNPTAEYSDLNGVKPGEELKQKPDTVAIKVFNIYLTGPNEKNIGNFYEGRPTEVLIKVEKNSINIKQFSVNIVGFSRPDGPTLTPTADPSVFALRWSPGIGVIPAGLNSAQLTISIQAVVTDASDSRLKNLERTEKLSLTVNRNISEIEWLGVSGLPKSIVESKTPIRFTVDIKDPGSANNPRIPEYQLTSFESTNTEAFVADASHFVKIANLRGKTNPEKLPGNGTRWRFHFDVTVDSLPLDRDRNGDPIANAGSVNACFKMRVTGAQLNVSSQKYFCFNGVYSAQAPTITIEEANVSEIQSGVESLFHIKAEVENPAAQVNLQSTGNQVKCQAEKPDKKNVLLCELRLKPVCSLVQKNTKVSLKFATHLNGKTKSQILTKDLILLPNPELCPAPAKKATAPADIYPKAKLKGKK